MCVLFKYVFPATKNGIPKWNGLEFMVSGTKHKYIDYSHCDSGWSTELTELHEREGGTGKHPIDNLSRNYALTAMSSILDHQGIILDVGCSSGYLLNEIKLRYPNANLIGADYLPEIVSRCSEKYQNIPMLQFDLRKCPLPDNSLDGVVALNVLEHIDEDEKALAHIFRVLKPGGMAYIEVPAGPTLYDFYDQVLMHHRRYSRKELIQKSKNAGFEVIRAFGIGWVLFPLFFAVKKKNRWLEKRLSEEGKKVLVAKAIQKTGGSSLLRFLLNFESAIGMRFALPFGIRHCAVLKKL